MQLYPLVFSPLLKERIWGGRNLKSLYGKPLPPGILVGESWEISDRPGDESIVANGPLAGTSLHTLFTGYCQELMGSKPTSERFPLLIKILDARDTLSLQVHPPPHRAADLGGQPKTEFWYVAKAEPGAELFVGLKRGTSRKDFEARLAKGSVAECFHRVKVAAGDSMFLPSGRVHALGGGLVIFEIQQNSDTTYRVFDWNRTGSDGRPRPLHVRESLESIDFGDYEPALCNLVSIEAEDHTVRREILIANELFTVVRGRCCSAARLRLEPGRVRIVALVEGTAQISGGGQTVDLATGRFVLIPASVSLAGTLGNSTTWLEISP